MNSLQFQSKLSFKDYRKLCIIEYYKKPLIILLLLFAVYNLYYSFTELQSGNLPVGILYFMGGLFMSALPLILSHRFAKNVYKINQWEDEQIVDFFFGPTKYTTKIGGSSSTIEWDHVSKINEDKKWIKVFYSNKEHHLINKEFISFNQVQEIKHYLNQILVLKNKIEFLE